MRDVFQETPEKADASKAWIITSTGRKFYHLAPTPDMISIEDIAHALSQLCRWTGHTRYHYCPTEEQRVLTSDLRWVSAGDIKKKQGLFGFDEEPKESGSAGNFRRKFRPNHATGIFHIKRQIVRLELADGSTVRTAAGHPWLVATKTSNNQKWETAEEIFDALKASRTRYMNRFLEVWKEDTSKEAGWLAGILDGEGHISFVNRSGVQFGVAQKDGLVWSRIKNELQNRGFSFNVSSPSDSVNSAQIKGGWRELGRLLGTIRPIRLLDKFERGLQSGLLNKQFDSIRDVPPLRIIRAWKEPKEWVVGLETKTHTYLCEGFAAHNSVAQHSWYCSHLVAPEFALAALLHDSSEAYLGDMNRPLKHFTPAGPAYLEIEEKVERTIFEKFGLPFPVSKEVKEADIQMLYAEKAQLMNVTKATKYEANKWGGDETEADIRIVRWTPRHAKKMFLKRFAELTKEK